MKRSSKEEEQVTNASNDASSKHQLLPRLAQVDNVDAIGTLFPNVLRHVHVGKLGAQVALGREQGVDVLLGRGKDCRHVGHFRGWMARRKTGVRGVLPAVARFWEEKMTNSPTVLFTGKVLISQT